MTAGRPVFPPVYGAMIWGFVLLVSFAGWGSIVARVTLPRQSVDLGLRLAWGMAVVIAAGGVTCLMSVATRPVLLAATGGGVIAAGVSVWCGWNGGASARRPRSLLTTAVLLGAIVLVGAQFYAGAAGGRLSTDDFNAYLVYPQRILSTGTLMERFSLRRLSSYGGQSFLHALTLLGAQDPRQISLFDQGICLAIVLALVVADRARAGAGLWLIPVMLLIVLPDIRGNSASQMSGVALLFAMFRTAVTPVFAASARRRALLLGLLAGAATTLRQWYLVAAVSFLVLFYLPDLLAALRLPGAARWKRLGDFGTATATMVIVLLPWWLLAYQAVGTPLYPLFSGNYSAQYGSLIGDNPRVDRWTFLWRNASYGYPVRIISIFLLAMLLLPWGATRGALPAFGVASLLGFLVIVVGFPLSDVVSMSRYYFAFFVSATLAVLWQTTSPPWTNWRGHGWRTALVTTLAVGAAIIEIVGAAPLFRSAGLSELSRDITDLGQKNSRYLALQDAVPPGAPLIVMFDHPYLFDFGRNPIEVIDLPGQVSPPPGMPFDSDDALATYLIDQGFRYLAFVKPESSINQYRREGWQRMIGPPASVLWGRAAPIILQALDRFESLGRNHWRLYEDGKFVAVDLEARMQ